MQHSIEKFEVHLWSSTCTPRKSFSGLFTYTADKSKSILTAICELSQLRSPWYKVTEASHFANSWHDSDITPSVESVPSPALCSAVRCLDKLTTLQAIKSCQILNQVVFCFWQGAIYIEAVLGTSLVEGKLYILFLSNNIFLNFCLLFETKFISPPDFDLQCGLWSFPNHSWSVIFQLNLVSACINGGILRMLSYRG